MGTHDCCSRGLIVGPRKDKGWYHYLVDMMEDEVSIVLLETVSRGAWPVRYANYNIEAWLL